MHRLKLANGPKSLRPLPSLVCNRRISSQFSVISCRASFRLANGSKSHRPLHTERGVVRVSLAGEVGCCCYWRRNGVEGLILRCFFGLFCVVLPFIFVYLHSSICEVFLAFWFELILCVYFVIH